MKQVYESKDGSRHKTAEEAERQDKLVDAQEAFAAAAEELSLCLGETALTADGQPFEPRRWRSYWRILTHYRGFPSVAEVSVYPHNLYIDTDRESDRLCVRWYENRDRGQGDYVTIPIKELYVSKEKATEAWLIACREYAAQVQKELAEIETKHGGRK